jgi:hypothetical protein
MGERARERGPESKRGALVKVDQRTDQFAGRPIPSRAMLSRSVPIWRLCSRDQREQIRNRSPHKDQNPSHPTDCSDRMLIALFEKPLSPPDSLENCIK